MREVTLDYWAPALPVGPASAADYRFRSVAIWYFLLNSPISLSTRRAADRGYQLKKKAGPAHRLDFDDVLDATADVQRGIFRGELVQPLIIAADAAQKWMGGHQRITSIIPAFWDPGT